eukprot:2351989-Pleurochrysis_carterae.AAC.1
MNKFYDELQRRLLSILPEYGAEPHMNHGLHRLCAVNLAANGMSPIGSKGEASVHLQQFLQLLNYRECSRLWGPDSLYNIMVSRCPICAPHTFLGPKPKKWLATSRYPSDIAI